MVKGYICDDHGFLNRCDTSEAGERICPECGEWVRGVTGRTRGRRAPPSDEPMSQKGVIRWMVNEGDHTVTAFDFRGAAAAAIELAEKHGYDPTHVRDVQPARREYRR